MLIRLDIDRELLSRKIKAGLDKRRDLGLSIGRPPKKILTDDEKTNLISDYTKAGSVRSVALKYGITDYTAYYILKDAGVVRHISRKQKRFPDSSMKPQVALLSTIYQQGDMVLESHCAALELAIESYKRERSKGDRVVLLGISSEDWKELRKEEIQRCQVCRTNFRFLGDSDLVVVKRRFVRSKASYFPVCSVSCKDAILALARRLKQEERTEWLQIERGKKLLRTAREMLKDQGLLSSQKEASKQDQTLQI